MLNSVKKMCKNRGPLLLALSGGSDSTALYHLMLQVGHPMEVLHVDHGWREESALEAQKLQSSISVPFHLRRLEKPSNNAEECARKERLCLYREICQQRGLDGVLLAHHADDQAETILKRIFEGARLTKLIGLEEERVVEGVTLLRPLLPHRKQELIDFLVKEGISFFVEKGGKDLRSRMREEMLPLLSASFGKEIVPALCRLANDAKELETQKENFWLKESVADFFEDQSVAISRPTLNAVSSHLLKNSRKKEMIIGQGRLLIDRGKLFYKRIDGEN